MSIFKKKHTGDLIIHYTNQIGSEDMNFIRSFNDFCNRYKIDTKSFVTASVETCMHKYIISHRSREANPDIMSHIDNDYYKVLQEGNTMRYRGYEAEIEYDAAEDVFCGTVLDVNGLLHFSGSSVSELRSKYHAAVDGYIAYWAKIQDDLEIENNKTI